jgi:two-component system, LytTR family, response regulator
MKVLILDDELKSREVLRALLQLYCPEVTSTILCASISEAVVAIKQHDPDVLFLDISLREGDSFQLLEQLGVFRGGIAFITAYDEFSVKALRFCKIPCLMKPIEIEKLQDVVLLLQNDLAQKVSYFSRYGLVRHLLFPPKNILPVFVQDNWLLLKANEIEWVESVDGKAVIVLVDEQIRTNYTFEELRKILLEIGFYKDADGRLKRLPS